MRKTGFVEDLTAGGGMIICKFQSKPLFAGINYYTPECVVPAPARR